VGVAGGNSTHGESLVCSVNCVYSTPVARIQIYLPDELAGTLKQQDVNVSRICREALLRATDVCPTCQRPYEEAKPARPVLPAPVKRVVRGDRSGRLGRVNRKR
jgi:post-segregation antitoxin (ccd killing protein)